MKIAEFFAELGVRADTYQLKDFSGTIGRLPLSTAAAITSLAGLSLSFGALFRDALQGANGLGVFRSMTGESTLELQRWSQMAKQFGIQGENVRSSILGIANAQVQMRLGNPGAAVAFSRLGISDWSNKRPFELLKDLREAYRRMNDPAMFTALAGQLGVSPEMTRLFDASDAEFNAAMNARPVIDRESERALQEFQKELAKFNVTVMQSLVPAFADITPHMATLGQALGFVVSTFGKAVGNVGAIGSLGKGFAGFANQNGVGGGGIVLDAINGLLSWATEYQANMAKYRPPDYVDQFNGKTPEWFEAKMDRLVEAIRLNSQDGRQVTINQSIVGSGDPKETGRIVAEETTQAIIQLGGRRR